MVRVVTSSGDMYAATVFWKEHTYHTNSTPKAKSTLSLIPCGVLLLLILFTV